jgi:8-hydroxy-5-deazaflavin:NADPH oxidoreductase
MKVAILGGTGKLGIGFVARLNLTPHETAVGTRDVSRAPSTVKAMPYADASAWCDAAIITVPYAAHHAVLGPLRGTLDGKIVIDATVPIHPQNFFRPATESGNSAAEETDTLLGKAEVFAGFHTISHRILRKTDLVEDVLVAGGPNRKGDVMQLIRDLNLRPIDAGPLAAAHLLECMTLLLLSINKSNHVKESGLKVTGI